MYAEHTTISQELGVKFSLSTDAANELFIALNSGRLASEDSSVEIPLCINGIGIFTSKHTSYDGGDYDPDHGPRYGTLIDPALNLESSIGVIKTGFTFDSAPLSGTVRLSGGIAIRGSFDCLGDSALAKDIISKGVVNAFAGGSYMNSLKLSRPIDGVNDSYVTQELFLPGYDYVVDRQSKYDFAQN